MEKDCLYLKLLIENDHLLHTRVTNWVYAETIFFVAYATLASNRNFYILNSIGVLGILIAIIFSISVFKLYIRLKWLIQQLIKDPEYQNFVKLEGRENGTNRLNNVLIKLIFKTNQPFYLDTGWLYSVGLFIIFFVTWVVILIFGNCNAPATIK